MGGGSGLSSGGAGFGTAAVAAGSAGAGGIAQLARAALVVGGLGLASAAAVAGVQALGADTLVPLITPVAQTPDVALPPLSFANAPSNMMLPMILAPGGGPGGSSPGGSGPGMGGGPPATGLPVTDVPVNVPEPASIVLLATGGLAALLLRVRRRQAA